MAKPREEDLRRVDEFLAVEKQLASPPPNWSQMQNGRWVAIWNIREPDDRVRAHLNFRVDPKYADFPGVSLIFEGHPMSRVDLGPQTMRKPNPPWAIECGPMVVGNHCHSWPDNRQHVLRTGSWHDLPAKRQVPPAVKRVPQMLRWFAKHINLRLYPPEHDFDFAMPPGRLI